MYNKCLKNTKEYNINRFIGHQHHSFLQYHSICNVNVYNIAASKIHVDKFYVKRNINSDFVDQLIMFDVYFVFV